MNIGSLIRGLLGEQKAGDVKQLDVKAGQVVRGVVLSVSDDGKEAEIQIQGVKVHAKLETPLQQGQATLLQVQPPEEGGLMVLKPLTESPYTSISPNSLGDVLKSVGLADTKANREMIQTLQASGVPLTKENAALFKAILMDKPAGVPAEQWIQSAAIAFQRGLPMTAESVRGLQQAVFGPPLHQLLSGLSEQLSLLAKNAGGAVPAKGMIGSQVAAGLQGGQDVTGGSGTTAIQGGQDTTGKTAAIVGSQLAQGSAGAQTMTGMTVENGGKGAAMPGATTAPIVATVASSLQPLLAKLQDVLQQLRGTQLPTNLPSQSATATGQPATATPSSGNPTGLASQPVAPQAGGATPPASATAAAPGGSAAAVVVPPATQSAASLGEAPAGASLRSAPTHGEAPWVGQMLKLLGAEHEQHAVRGGGTPQAQATAGNAQQSSAAPALPVPQPPAVSSAASATLQSNAAATQAANPPSASQAQATQTTNTPVVTQAQVTINAPEGMLRSAMSLPTMAGNVGSPEALSMNHDSLKGILLQMLDRSDLPPALKEAAQQLVQHMTGQQLLLNTDRTAPFAQVTMFIPLNGQDGEETASVHIQSRRGKKGELDASNCHLWFDLDMKHLGSTLIDVQVVDKIVSLKVHNDHEWMTSLIEDRRDEISEAIQSIGYQLLSLRTEPLPKPTVVDLDNKQGSVTSEYTPPSYKGVDMRI